MYRFKSSLVAALALLSLVCAQRPSFAQAGGGPRAQTPAGDDAFELVGQVLNVPLTPNSKQYGYLSFVNGVDDVFSGGPQNETTALFTFFTEAVTTRVINDGNLRVVNRTGTTTVYFDDTPDGNFADPETFRDGTPVLTMSLRQQVILDTAEGTFTTVNFNTVTSAPAFSVGGETIRLAKERDQFRTFISGRTNTTGTPAGFVIAGYAVAIEPANPGPQ
jgi:hypothetical protein